MYNSDMPSYVVRIFAGDINVIPGIENNFMNNLSLGMK